MNGNAMKTRYSWLLCFMLLSGCSMVFDNSVGQASFQQAALNKKPDEQGWYHFAGFDFKGRLLNGVPDGVGICRDARKGQEQCQFDRGMRTDEKHVLTAASEEVQRKEERRETAREQAAQDAILEERARERERSAAQANREAFMAFQSNLNAAAANLAAQDRETQSLVANVNQERQAQRQREAEEREAQQNEARRNRLMQENLERQRAEMRSAQARQSQSYPSQPNPSLQQSNLSQSVSSSSSKNQTPKTVVMETPKRTEEAKPLRPKSSSQIIRLVGEGSSDFCFPREKAEGLARFEAKEDAGKDCAERKGELKKEAFIGYMSCKACTGFEKGNFKCKATQATWECEIRDQ